MTHTLREQLKLGPALTDREASARTIEDAFNLPKPRQDMHHVDVLAYTPGIANPGAHSRSPATHPTRS